MDGNLKKASFGKRQNSTAVDSLKYSSPLKIGHPKRKNRIPTIHFHGRTVSFREVNIMYKPSKLCRGSCYVIQPIAMGCHVCLRIHTLRPPTISWQSCKSWNISPKAWLVEEGFQSSRRHGKLVGRWGKYPFTNRNKQVQVGACFKLEVHLFGRLRKSEACIAIGWIVKHPSVSPCSQWAPRNGRDSQHPGAP